MRRGLVRWGIVVAALAVSVGVFPTTIQGQERVALVIGNAAYRQHIKLDNPTNDASDIAAALSRLGFSVTKLENAGIESMRRGLVELGRRARGAEMAAVFYAGHGMEFGGDNWLIAVDAALRSDADTDKEAVALREVLRSVEGATTLGLVILDACRDNPLAANMQRTARSRELDKGLKRVAPPDNVLVAYSAQDGATAIDGSGRNSPFTSALLRHIETPGLDIQFVFRRVRDDVLASTQREQIPYVYGSLSQRETILKFPSETVAARTPESRPATASKKTTVATEVPPRKLDSVADEGYPRRAITLVVAFAPGGPSDVMARAVADRLSKSLGKPVVVENKTGEGGVAGTRAVAKAAADGYTLLLGDTVTHGINPSLVALTGYDPHNDFEPVGPLGAAPLALVAHPSVPGKSVPEILEFLRANPQRATYAIAGKGTLSHLVGHQFASAARLNMRQIPFAGEGPAFKALLDGEASLHFAAFGSSIADLANTGRLRVVALTGTKPSGTLPKVPTLAASGLAGFEAVRNYGLLAPAGTPRPIIDKLNAALRAAVVAPDVRAKLTSFGVETAPMTPHQHASLIDREIAKWLRIMRDAGVQPK